MPKNNSRTFGSNRNGPGFRTPSSFRAQVSEKRLGKHQINPRALAFRGTRNKAP